MQDTIQTTDNFSETLLLAELPVTFRFGEQKVSMRIPTVKDLTHNPLLQQAISVSMFDIDELQKQVPMFEVESIWDFFNVIITGNTYNNPIKTSFIELFIFCFGTSLNIENSIWTLNKWPLNESWFNRIMEILQISILLKKFNEQACFKQKTTKKELELEKRIKKIKNQSNKNISKQQVFQDLTNLMISINLEFGYTFEQLFNMNYYHLNILQQYVPKAISYDIQKRSHAVGLSKKKLKYITDK